MGQTLADIAVGEKETIVGFNQGGQGWRQKFLAMGLIKGTALIMQQDWDKIKRNLA